MLEIKGVTNSIWDIIESISLSIDEIEQSMKDRVKIYTKYEMSWRNNYKDEY